MGAQLIHLRDRFVHCHQRLHLEIGEPGSRAEVIEVRGPQRLVRVEQLVRDLFILAAVNVTRRRTEAEPAASNLLAA